MLLKNINSKGRFYFPVIFIFFFVFAQIVDGINIFGIRWISACFLVMLVVFHALKRGKISTKNWFIYGLLFVIIPVYGLFRTGFNSDLSDLSDTSQLSFSILLFATIYFQFGGNAQLAIKIMVSNLRLLSFSIIAIFVFNYFGGYYPSFFVGNEMMFFGEREYGGVTFNFVYFISSPLLLFLVAYDSYSLIDRLSILKLFFLLVTISALFLSGTRSLIIFSLASFFFVSFWFGTLRTRIFCAVVVFLTAALILYSYIDVYFSMFSVANSAAKLSYLSGYGEIFGNSIYFLFGQGWNANAWSPDFIRMLDSVGNPGVKTELTYLELMRVYGAPMGAIITILLFSLPFIGDGPKEYQWLRPALFMYLILAATNPYIFSSNGVIAFGVYLGFLRINKGVELYSHDTSTESPSFPRPL